MIIHKVHIFYHEFVATFFGHKVSQENMELELSDVALCGQSKHLIK